MPHNRLRAWLARLAHAHWTLWAYLAVAIRGAIAVTAVILATWTSRIPLTTALNLILSIAGIVFLLLGAIILVSADLGHFPLLRQKPASRRVFALNGYTIMFVGLMNGSIGFSRLVAPTSPGALVAAFSLIIGAPLVIGLLVAISAVAGALSRRVQRRAGGAGRPPTTNATPTAAPVSHPPMSLPPGAPGGVVPAFQPPSQWPMAPPPFAPGIAPYPFLPGMVPYPSGPATPLRISRRTAIVALAATGLAVAAGGWLLRLAPGVIARYSYSASDFLSFTFATANSLAWSPNGRRIVCGLYSITDSSGSTVRAWDALTGEHAQTYNEARLVGEVKSVAWSSDGRYIAAAMFNNDGALAVWDATTGQLALTGQAGFGGALAWQPHSHRLTVNSPNFDGVTILDAVTGAPYAQLTNAGGGLGANSFAWSPDGRYLAISSDGITVWEVATQRLHKTYPVTSQLITPIAWSPDGRLLAWGTDDGAVQVWRVATGERFGVFRVPQPLDGFLDFTNEAVAQAITWSPDSKQIAIGVFSAAVYVWRVRPGVSSQADFTWRGHAASINSVQWSPDGAWIASASDEGLIQVWRPQEGGWL